MRGGRVRNAQLLCSGHWLWIYCKAWSKTSEKVPFICLKQSQLLKNNLHPYSPLWGQNISHFSCWSIHKTATHTLLFGWQEFPVHLWFPAVIFPGKMLSDALNHFIFLSLGVPVTYWSQAAEEGEWQNQAELWAAEPEHNHVWGEQLWENPFIC